MATNMPPPAPSDTMAHFNRVAEQIERMFNQLIEQLIQRKDALLQKVVQMREEFLNKEKTRIEADRTHVQSADRTADPEEGRPPPEGSPDARGVLEQREDSD